MRLKNRALSVYKGLLVVSFSALALVLQMLHSFIGISTGTGMVVDLVAVPAYILGFVYGWEYGIGVLVLSCIGIAFTSPATWLGAFMKFSSTLVPLLVFWIVDRVRRSGHKWAVGEVVATALVGGLGRAILMIPLNIYVAIPLFFKVNAMVVLSKFSFFGYSGIVVFAVVLGGWNLIQTLIEAVLAYYLTYEFGVAKMI